MSDIFRTVSGGDTGTSRLSRIHLILIWSALALLVVGLFARETVLGTAAMSMGLVLTAISVAARLRSTRADETATTRLKDLMARDPRAVFVTDPTGAIQQRNPATISFFDDNATGNVEQLLSKRVPDVGAVTFRLQTRALREGSASEHLGAEPRGLSLTVHKVGTSRLVWAASEPMQEARVDPEPRFVAMPMCIASGTGAILRMSPALRKLVGARAKTISAVFETVPHETADDVNIMTPTGLQSMRVEVLRPDDDRDVVEYYLTPSVARRGEVASLDFLEEFPVALMKISTTGSVLDTNRLARALIGIDGNHAAQLQDMVEGLDRPLIDWLTEAFRGHSLHKPEVLRVKSGETEKYVQITLGRMVDDGEVSLLALLNDATELKTLEAQFVQSQKMQAIGQLAGGVAHDFNNLLTAISGHCDLLMLRHDQGDPEYGDLEQINQNANRAASLVSQLLAFSRKQNLHLEVIDMRDTLADLTHLLNRLVGAQISLTLSHDPQLMPVRSDRRQLEQVIMNLVVNARDAMTSGGKITIDTCNRRLEHDLHRDRAMVPRGEYVVVKVTDNGRGIPSDKLNKIFEPFFTTKRVGEGTGLGLSTVYGIIKQSGGFIFVDSELGKGSTFTIYFPSAKPQETPQLQAPPRREKLDLTPAEGVVLLVEDEAPVRAFASRALKLRGFEVVEAEHAERAIQLLAEGLRVDVVVSDVVMPGMDGPTWVRKARETHPDLKVIFVSGYAEDSFGEDQKHLADAVFLPKPFSLNELTSMVQEQIGAGNQAKAS